jgi:putative polyhydroxyalkanoate system protein
MADIHIHRDHHFSLPKARKIAFAWAEQAENEFGMDCTYEEGDAEDLVTFTRSGVKGTLKVCARRFELDAQLGFLLGAFKDKIEGEIVKNLDQLLAAGQAGPAKAAARKATTPGTAGKPARGGKA